MFPRRVDTDYTYPCRVRVPFLQLKEAVVLAQALYRGRKARAMLPYWRKEKAHRDVSKNWPNLAYNEKCVFIATEEETCRLEEERHISRYCIKYSGTSL